MPGFNESVVFFDGISLCVSLCVSASVSLSHLSSHYISNQKDTSCHSSINSSCAHFFTFQLLGRSAFVQIRCAAQFIESTNSVLPMGGIHKARFVRYLLKMSRNELEVFSSLMDHVEMGVKVTCLLDNHVDPSLV